MRRRSLLLLVLAVAAGFSAAAVAQGDDEARGRDLLSAVDARDRDCGDLDDGDFEMIGEYLMGRMVGDAESHDAMDRIMRSMMGERGEEAAHERMGRRFAGCGGGALGGMMGMMMGGGYGGGMMGGGYDTYDGDRGSMMGFGRSGVDRADDDDDWDGGDTAMVVMMALLLILAVVVLWLFRPGRRHHGGGGPLEILSRRFAAGEIDQEEYERRRQALGGKA